MPRNGSGTYTLPEASFVGGTVISSDAVNSDLSDIALALTGSVAADGQTPITGSFLLADGSEGSPSYSFITDTDSGFYHPEDGVIALSLNGEASFVFAPTPSSDAGMGLVLRDGVNPVPIGIVLDWAGDNGNTVPTGWLLCDGSAVNRTSFSRLFDVIGTTYGSGNGTTTYNVPDLRGRVVAGRDNMGGSNADRLGDVISSTTIGATGGDQGVALSESELATHNHGGTTDAESNPHTHTIDFIRSGNTPSGGVTSGGNNNVITNGSTGTSNENVDHTHTFDTDAAGSGDSHLNAQPTMIMNKIIYAAQVA